MKIDRETKYHEKNSGCIGRRTSKRKHKTISGLFVQGATDAGNEKYPVKDAALLMTSADDLFWTYEQAVSYYKFTVINYIGFHDKGMLLAGGYGDTNGKPQIDKTNHLKEAYEFGKTIYKE